MRLEIEMPTETATDNNISSTTRDTSAGPSAESKPLKVSSLLHNSTSNIVTSPSQTKVPRSAQNQPFGGFSFESESLPDFSEFEGNTSGSEGQQEPLATIDGTVPAGIKKRKPGDERLF